jgi:hypothetical protein
MENRFLRVLVLSFLLSSCSFLPTGTDMWINSKLNNTPLGSSREQVQDSFGNPIYRIKYPQGNSLIEVWGYEVGNYWYHESLTVFFKDGQFIGIPRKTYDLLVFMHELGLVDPRSQFVNTFERQSA